MKKIKHSNTGVGLLLAACALPGLLPSFAIAETIPEKSLISAKIMSYNQDQADGSIVNQSEVSSPAIYLAIPVAGQWLVEGSITHDNVSGASPRYHTSGASHMSDERVATNVRVKRYFAKSTLAAGVAYSTENDYQSTALSIAATSSSLDNNTTWSAGLAFTNDEINPVNLVVVDEKRSSIELQAGVTQVLTPVDIAQISFTFSDGNGYYSDPYKPYDARPRDRSSQLVLMKWNHHFKELNLSSKASYRFYTDSFGVSSSTLGLELVKPLANGWTVTPSVRYFTQNKANFYFDPPFPNGQKNGSYYSTDQRLASVAGLTLGAKISKQLSPDSSIDFKLETYQQNKNLFLGSGASQGLSDLRATIFQIGYSVRF